MPKIFLVKSQEISHSALKQSPWLAAVSPVVEFGLDLGFLSAPISLL